MLLSPYHWMKKRKKRWPLGSAGKRLRRPGGDRRRIPSAVQGTNERPADFAPVSMRVEQHRQGRGKPFLPERPEERPDLLPSFLRGQRKVFLDPFMVLPRLRDHERSQPFPELLGNLGKTDLPADDPGLIVGVEEVRARVAHLDVDIQLPPKLLLHGAVEVIPQQVGQLLAVHDAYATFPSLRYRESCSRRLSPARWRRVFRG